MNRQYIESNDVIERYLRKQLTEDELNLFEVYLLDNPKILDEIRVEETLRKELKDNSDLLRSAENSTLSSAKSNYRSYALAASLVFCAFLLAPLFESSSPQLQEAVLLESFRGQDQFVYEISGEPIVQFLVDAGMDADGDFSIALIEESSGNEVARTSNLQPTSEGLILYSLTETEHLTGRYTLIVLNSVNGSRSSFELDFL